MGAERSGVAWVKCFGDLSDAKIRLRSREMFGSRTPSPHLSEEGRNTLGDDELFSQRARTPPPIDMAVPLLHSSRESNGIDHRARSLGNGGGFGLNGGGGAEPGMGGGGGRDQVGDAEAPPRVRQYRRPLPQPRPFEGRGEESITHFFRVYERYATSAWSDDQSDWVAGLENFLLSWPLTLYRGLVIQGKTYPQIKDALCKSFPGYTDPLNTRCLLRLLNLKRESGEPLSVFFMRTDNLIGQTYPRLDENSRQVMVRDTFLIKIESATSAKIANYCNSRDDFGYDAVRVAAAVMDAPDYLNGESQETVLLTMSKPESSLGKQSSLPNGSGNEMKCYLCGGSWHPVSACPLYPMVFTCPLCRVTTHAVTDCALYPKLMKIRNQGAAWGNTDDGYYRGNIRGDVREDRYSAQHRNNYRYNSSNDRSVWPYRNGNRNLNDSQDWRTEERDPNGYSGAYDYYGQNRPGSYRQNREREDSYYNNRYDRRDEGRERRERYGTERYGTTQRQDRARPSRNSTCQGN